MKYTHNEALQRAGLPSVETLTRRVLRWFDTASPSQIEEGARWYDEATDLAVSLAPHIDTDEASVAVAAQVIAALSPRTFWSRNVAGAYALIVHDEALPGLIGRNIEMARRILDGEEGVLKGPKTRAFAKNVAGDREAVTVDVHAAYAAGVDEDLLRRHGVYEAVAHAYRLAARRRGVDPATMQATVWVVARRQRLSDQRRNR